MKPSQISNQLRQIATAIDNSKNPSRKAVSQDLRRVLVAMDDFNTNLIDRLISSTEQQLKELVHATNLYKQNPVKYKEQIENIKAATRELNKVSSMVLRRVFKVEI
jgi:hypothetical protein